MALSACRRSRMEARHPGLNESPDGAAVQRVTVDGAGGRTRPHGFDGEMFRCAPLPVPAALRGPACGGTGERLAIDGMLRLVSWSACCELGCEPCAGCAERRLGHRCGLLPRISCERAKLALESDFCRGRGGGRGRCLRGRALRAGFGGCFVRGSRIAAADGVADMVVDGDTQHGDERDDDDEVDHAAAVAKQALAAVHRCLPVDRCDHRARLDDELDAVCLRGTEQFRGHSSLSRSVALSGCHSSVRPSPWIGRRLVIDNGRQMC